VKAFAAYLAKLFPSPLPWDALVSDAAAKHKKTGQAPELPAE
jgi:hypothetical protein